jgi:hypothetical protein
LLPAGVDGTRDRGAGVGHPGRVAGRRGPEAPVELAGNRAGAAAVATGHDENRCPAWPWRRSGASGMIDS